MRRPHIICGYRILYAVASYNDICLHLPLTYFLLHQIDDNIAVAAANPVAAAAEKRKADAEAAAAVAAAAAPAAAYHMRVPHTVCGCLIQ
jgi:hypothetical protein